MEQLRAEDYGIRTRMREVGDGSYRRQSQESGGTMRWWKMNLDEWAREVRRRIYLNVGNLENSLKLPRKG